MAEDNKNPEETAQKAMRPKQIKRFYDTATIVEAGDGEFAIHLDGRVLKTPLRKTLILPGKNSAQIVADEWQAQMEHINPALMPATKLANTAIDGIADDPQAVLEDMLKYAASDLLCYRATTPAGLVELQKSNWDPVLDWAGEALGVWFETTTELVQIPQSRESVAAVGLALKQWPHPIALGALHTFTALTGSVLLALAIGNKHLDVERAWKIGHVDEDWNISRWGEDYEAKTRRENRWRDMVGAAAMLVALTSDLP